MRGAAVDRRGGDVRGHAVVDRVVRRVVVDDEVLVRRRALRRDAARRADEVDQLLAVGAVLRARRGDDVLLQHHRAEVVGPVVERELPDLLARREPRALDVGDVVEVDAGDRDHPQVLEHRGLGAALEVVVLGLVRVRDEGAEAARAVLHLADHAQVLDALGVRLARAHEHRDGGLDAQVVGGLHDLQPALAGLLERCDGLAGPRGQEFGARAREGVEPGGVDAADRLLGAHAGDAGHVVDLGGAQGVDDELRERLLDRGEVLLVVLDAVVRVVPALEHDLRAAELDGLRAAAQDVVQVAAPPLLRVLGGGVEGAELAGRHADVRVVDVALDDVRRDVLRTGVAAAADRVGGGAERMQRRVAVEVERLLGGDATACGGTVEDGLKVGLLGHRLSPFGGGSLHSAREVRTDSAYAPGVAAPRRRGAGRACRGRTIGGTRDGLRRKGRTWRSPCCSWG
ncbi:hypothetical protein STTU_2647 [Streptomyces sp. Tu6071]|nr:hypothetical protein STTU_2647 [Streptomyces sp. Tu6071]